MKTVGLLFEGKAVQKKAATDNKGAEAKPKQAKKPAAPKGAEAKAGEGDN